MTDHRDQVKRQQGDKPSLTARLDHGLQNARQRMQPAAYRIAAPAKDGHTQQEIVKMNHSEQPGSGDDAPSSLEDQLASAIKALAAVATAVWRANAKLNDDAQASLPPELRHLPRHIQAACDALAAGHVEIEDPTGQRYDPGMAVNVLTFQPVEGIGCETIHETLKPAVYCNNKLIQRADIIVARPFRESDAEAGQPVTDDNDAIVGDAPSNEKGSNAHDSNND